MNKKVLLILLFLFSSNVFAEEKTLLKGKIEYGGFGGPEFRVTSINGETAILTGGRGGWIINHTFVIGGGGYGLATEHDAPGDLGKDNRIEFGYGGFEMEYIVKSDELIHCSFFTLLGVGSVRYCQKNNENDDNSDSDNLFVVEPAVNGEINITKWFRINAGISYRFINGTDIEGLKDSHLGGLGAGVTLKFGKF